ncbi:F-box domain-containing protein [Mycena kentingensis (nom. inval.)]|nr:F-box domain-containing protein [Mycena kentingensis (nom. inval.)]
MPPPATDHTRAIERLPPELLGEIFAFTLPCLRRAGSKEIPTAPWWLGHVCTQWRSAALAHAVLWCDVSLYAAYDTPTLVACGEKMLAAQLARSRSASLHIQLHWFDYGARASDGVSTLVDMLVQHSERWEKLLVDLNARFPEPILDALACARGRLPRLHTLDIHYPGQIVGYTSWATYGAFVAAPKLTTLSITGFMSELSVTKSLPLPRDQIATFRVKFSHQDAALDALLAFPNLKELRLSVVESDSRRTHRGRPFETLARVKLPELRVLQLDTRSNVIEWLSLPSLRNLHLLSGGLRAVPDMLRRSRCPLVRLVIESNVNTGQVLAILPHCPALRELKLGLREPIPNHRRPAPPAVLPYECIRALADGDGEGILPVLENLDLVVEWGELNREMVLRMLEMRAARGALKRARIAGLEGPMDIPPFAERVRVLKEGGTPLELLAS